jgi:hypothetical protein
MRTEDRGYAQQNMLISSAVECEQRTRDRVYSDDEVTAIWKAVDQLDKVEGAFVKLLLLLAPRKTALACLRRSISTTQTTRRSGPPRTN